jgi:CTP:molybdopterin cytidylyltransferase MocA
VNQGAIAGVLLAAGGGTRLGRPKALVELGGRSLLARGVGTLSDAGCRPVVVVLGADSSQAAVAAATAATSVPVRVVVNPAWADGMSTSLRAGLDALSDLPTAPQPFAAVVALADQPGIDAAVLERLVAAWRDRGIPVVVAAFGGRPRNPVLLDSTVWAAVLAMSTGDAGARDWIRANLSDPRLVELVECSDIGSETDIDTAEELVRAEQALAQQAVAQQTVAQQTGIANAGGEGRVDG